MSWRMAKSLDVLLAEVNASAPRRSKVSDGGIGDAAHASRTSDHNPWVKVGGVGVVRARDFTDDPPGGLSARALADHLASLLGKHPALGTGGYVIFNGRIISTSRRGEGWRPYTGLNAHKQHVHVSVGLNGFDSTAPWNWPPQEDDMTPAQAKKLDETHAAVQRLERQFEKERKRDKSQRERDKRRFQRLRDHAKGNADMLAAIDSAIAELNDEEARA